MDVKFFGQYLLEKNIISREELLQAMHLQSDTNASLGELALKNGFLSKEQVDRIQDYQIQHNVSFVAACNKLQTLPSRELDRLISSQLTNNLLLGEALIRNRVMDQEALDRHFHNFRKEQSTIEFGILQSITTHPHADLIGIVIQSITNLLRYLMDYQVRIGNFDGKSPAGTESYDWVVFQKVQGDINFFLEIFVRESPALKITSSLAKRPVEAMDELGMDALKEFINVIVGYICSMLSLRNLKCNPDVPLIQKSKDIATLGEPLHLELLVPEDTLGVNIILLKD